jgi:phenylacetate-CoA ligase
VWNPAIEQLPRPELEALQLARLRWSVGHARAANATYRERFDKAGVDEARLKSLDDLRRLPFTVKADLREHYPFGLFAAPLGQVVRIHASSGTRGKPTVVGYTRHDLAVWSEVMARCLAHSGAGPGTVLHIAYGYGLFTGGLGFHMGGELIGCTVLPLSSGNTARQILMLRDLGSQVLACTPSYALNIAGVLADEGVSPNALHLVAGLFGAEPWGEGMREAIQAGLGIRAFDVYGLSEIIGPGVAAECEAQDGLHVQEDHFLPEIVDPESGEPLPDGSEGELVFTSLSKEALPVLRYRTGDISTLEHAPCRCGRTSVRMARVKGRRDDMLIIRGVNLYPSEVERVLAGIPALAPHYQLVLRRDRALDSLEVHAEVSESFFETLDGRWTADGAGEPPSAVLELARRARGALLDETTVRMDVTLRPPRSLARSEGKAVRVLDLRDD